MLPERRLRQSPLPATVWAPHYPHADPCLPPCSRPRYSSSMKSLGNKFMHLTNYSVNKKNTEYKANADETACQGHKW